MELIMKSKMKMLQEKIRIWESKIRCPICHNAVTVTGNQMLCQDNHTFDLAKQGYLNLFMGHKEEQYNQALFDSRYELMKQSKFYEGLYKQIKQILLENNFQSPNSFIIDLGTGEGTHLSLVTEALSQSNSLGLDIEKAGIQTAAKHYTNALWMVADLGNIPLKNQTLDGAFTILTPSNYEEVNRVLNEKGWFLKIIPGTEYLKELREIVLPEEKVPHLPIPSIERFEEHFHMVQQSEFRNTYSLNEKDRENLLKMTPLMWNATEEQLIQANKLKKVTIDLILLFGIKN